MAAFNGINLGVDAGNVTYVSAHKVKIQTSVVSNPGITGVVLYIDFTRGGAAVTTYTLTATFINPTIHATNEYDLDSSSTATPAVVSKTFTATKRLIWPIAVPSDTSVQLVLTGTYTGTPDSTDVVLVQARRDTVSG